MQKKSLKVKLYNHLVYKILIDKKTRSHIKIKLLKGSTHKSLLLDKFNI